MTENYYSTIKGKRYDRSILDKAKKSIKAKGDGRISINDAKTIIRAVKDGNVYTDIEKRTIRYIRDNFKFTKEAEQFFRKEIRQWTSKKDPGKKFAITRKPKQTKQKKILGSLSQSKSSKMGSIAKGSVKKAKGSSVKLPSAKTKIAPLSVMSPKKSLPGSLPMKSTPDSTARYIRFGIGLCVLAILALLAYFYKNYSALDSKKASLVLKNKATENNLSSSKKVEKSKLKTIKKVSLPEKTKTVKIARKIKPATIQKKPKVKAKKNIPSKTIKKQKPSESKEFTYYTVKYKDQLSTISNRFLGDYARWKEIYELNKKSIQDPNLIYPSQVIKIPK